MRTVVISCLMVPYASYGMLAIRLARGLRSMGYMVKMKPEMYDERFAAVPEDVKSTLVFQVQPDEWEFVVAPPTYKDGTEGTSKMKKRVIFTLWETDQLKEGTVGLLNTSQAVITASKWNQEAFRRSGVKVPIFVVPLGYDPKVYWPEFRRLPSNRKIVFGTAVRTAHGGVRKGAHVVTWAFLKAFDGVTKGVELRLKGFPDCKFPTVWDPRIKLTREYLSDEAMRQWYQGLTCFVSGSTSEGWGLHHHEAMACAKPVMSVDYGGVKEFFQPSLGYAIPYQEVQCSKDTYEGIGRWAAPDELQLATLMRHVYDNQVDAFVRGLRAYDAVKHLTWDHSVEQFAGVLGEVGLI